VLLSAALATTVVTTGCRDHHHDRGDDSQPAAQPAAQPAQDETVVYNQWEAETHRAHRDLAQRTAAEQREYRDWHQQHR
jgi:hypothetical protein